MYNDAYTLILGAKHPSALGAPGRDVWPEIWDIIGPMLAMATSGQATPADDLMLMLERSGYTEECYFSFSYSPIRDESGGVGGVFCPVIETTDKVIGQRRSELLRCLVDRMSNLLSEHDLLLAAAACLKVEGVRDFPFVTFCIVPGEGRVGVSAYGLLADEVDFSSLDKAVWGDGPTIVDLEEVNWRPPSQDVSLWKLMFVAPVNHTRTYIVLGGVDKGDSQQR